MTSQEIRLQFGEMNAEEMRLAKAIVAHFSERIAELERQVEFKDKAMDGYHSILKELRAEVARREGEGAQREIHLRPKPRRQRRAGLAALPAGGV